MRMFRSSDPNLTIFAIVQIDDLQEENTLATLSANGTGVPRSAPQPQPGSNTTSASVGLLVHFWSLVLLVLIWVL